MTDHPKYTYYPYKVQKHGGRPFAKSRTYVQLKLQSSESRRDYYVTSGQASKLTMNLHSVKSDLGLDLFKNDTLQVTP